MLTECLIYAAVFVVNLPERTLRSGLFVSPLTDGRLRRQAALLHGEL